MTEATPGRERSDAGIVELWRRFAGGDGGARHGLIVHYAPLVKFVAGRIGAGLPKTVEPQDLVSYGTIGLIDAVDKFDPQRGVRFETYASVRIRGSIVDALRRLDWVPRSVRTRAREIQRGLADLEHRLQRSPTESELADHLGMDVAKLRSALGDVAAGGVIGLDELGSEEGPALREVLADPAAADPAGVVDRKELRRILIEAIRGLPDRERDVVAMYYFEAMTLAQIGGILDITESRVSQIHAKAVLSLRNRIALAMRPG